MLGAALHKLVRKPARFLLLIVAINIIIAIVFGVIITQYGASNYSTTETEDQHGKISRFEELLIKNSRTQAKRMAELTLALQSIVPIVV
jgi:hypothetical protein